MPTPDQIAWLREDVDADDVSLPSGEAENLFARAEALYTDAEAVRAATRVFYLRGLLANSAKMVTYRQNQTTENASDIFDHVKFLLEYWETNLQAIEDRILSAEGSARFGRVKKIPTKLWEYPDST